MYVVIHENDYHNWYENYYYLKAGWEISIFAFVLKFLHSFGAICERLWIHFLIGLTTFPPIYTPFPHTISLFPQYIHTLTSKSEYIIFTSFPHYPNLHSYPNIYTFIICITLVGVITLLTFTNVITLSNNVTTALWEVILGYMYNHLR